MSARLIAIMAPFYLVRFVASPLTFMTIIAEEQLFEMLWQIAYLLASAAGIWLGYLISPAIESLLLGYGIAFCGMYAIHVFCTYRLAKGGGCWEGEVLYERFVSFILPPARQPDQDFACSAATGILCYSADDYIV